MLFAVAGNASAEWEYFDYKDGSTIYFDKSKFKRSGNYVKVWFLFNEDKSSPISGHSSVVSLFEYDCKEGRERVLQGAAHKGHMGQGAVVFSADVPEPWVYVAPNNFREPRLKLACKK